METELRVRVILLERWFSCARADKKIAENASIRTEIK